MEVLKGECTLVPRTHVKDHESYKESVHARSEASSASILENLVLDLLPVLMDFFTSSSLPAKPVQLPKKQLNSRAQIQGVEIRDLRTMLCTLH